AAVHLSIVLTFLIIFAMLYTAISNKISFLMVSLASLIGVVVFYISIIFVFGFGEHFEATTTELIVLGFLRLTNYFGVGSYYQRNQMQDI
ncbi:adenylate/guanylate cyclase domain-containing protein, partial [bacterium LRH843]|nr:adenylate/guanylate cyclase domain-containing protein [bacterium LRH843]